ncbi:MAG TPA: DHA2 family efflux MFS transporter permease subunit [Streptosporangiaceae bacterium]|nr:DHA2 family efflux MFS transporter permease subunit [Streptosporangiaceae bacterium]
MSTPHPPAEAPARGLLRLLAEPPRPAAVRNSPKAPWLVVAAVCIGAFMGQLDASIVTLAFPTLRHDFSAPLASVQWVGQAYLLVLIGLLTAVGRYADMAGRKLLYTYGFVIFIIGSSLCGLAPSLPALVGFRVLQGVGAAMLQANSVAIIAGAVPRERLGRAIGVQGGAQALGLALGPAAGGLLISLGGWRLIFFVNVPVGLIGTVLAWFLIPRSRHLAARARFDWAGLGIFLPATCALLLAISYGDHDGWASLPITGGFTVAVLLLAAFIVRERRAPAPMLDLSLLRRVPFTAGIASGLLSYLVLFGILTVVPFYLEIALHAPPASAGLQLLVVPLGVGLTAPIAGRLADRVGARPLTVGGMTVTALMLIVTTLVHAHPMVFLLALAAAGIGLGAFTPPNNAAIMGAAPPHQTGMASGILNMTRGLGTSLGLALAGLAYTIGASAGEATPAGAAAGYDNAALLLAALAALAAVIAAFRGKTQLTHDPTLTAE